MEGRPEKVVPKREKAAEIHLGFMEGLPMVPAMVFRHGEDEAEPARPVGDIAMLKQEVNVEHGQEAGHGLRRGPEQPCGEKARSPLDEEMEWVSAFAVQGIKALRAMMDGSATARIRGGSGDA
jgi:hypothetical protein